MIHKSVLRTDLEATRHSNSYMDYIGVHISSITFSNFYGEREKKFLIFRPTVYRCVNDSPAQSFDDPQSLFNSFSTFPIISSRKGIIIFFFLLFFSLWQPKQKENRGRKKKNQIKIRHLPGRCASRFIGFSVKTGAAPQLIRSESLRSHTQNLLLPIR